MIKEYETWWFGFTLVLWIGACIGLRNRVVKLWLGWEIRYDDKFLLVRLRDRRTKIKTHTRMKEISIVYDNYTKNNTEYIGLYILILMIKII